MRFIHTQQHALRHLSLMALFSATLAACGPSDDEVANVAPASSTPTAAPVTAAPVTPAPVTTVPAVTTPTTTTPPSTTPTTAPVSSTISAGDCLYNAQLLTPGTTYQQDLVFGQGAQSIETQSRFRVLGTGTFNGVSAVETQLDTTVIGSALPASASTAGRSFLYNNIVGTDYVNYGLKTVVTSASAGITSTVSSTAVNTPATRFPITAKVGDTVSQTYSVRTTVEYSFTGAGGIPPIAPSITERTETLVWKFLALETISVAAGTFQTCKFETTSTSTQNNVTTSTTGTGWAVASGPARSLLAKVSDASGQVLEAKVLRVN
jgi:hypothetical protein